jgi:hypothetical protein
MYEYICISFFIKMSRTVALIDYLLSSLVSSSFVRGCLFLFSPKHILLLTFGMMNKYVNK